MSDYLYSHYRGRYRVMANLDTDLHDVPRDAKGVVLDSYADTYIECVKNGQIYHIGGNVLEAYIPSLKRGRNIINQILDSKVNIIESIETDSEVIFKFKAKDIDAVAIVMGAKTKGSKDSPYSTAKLPKCKYKILEDSQDWIEYKNITSKLPQGQTLFIAKVQGDYLATKIKKHLPKGMSISADMKMKDMSAMQKEYIHSLGLWTEYLKYLDLAIINKYGLTK